MKVELSGIAETLLIPTRVRAYETQLPKPLLRDPWAVNILQQLNIEKSNKDKIFSGTLIGTIIRTLLIDEKIIAFIDAHPDGVLVNLGCGLDARYHRLCKPTNSWFDLDILESITIRKSFFDETVNYKMITSSMFDYTWIDQIPKNRPILIFFEGVSMFFPELMLKPFILEIFKQFPQANIVFDVISRRAAKNVAKHPDVKKYNTEFKWGIDSALELLDWDKNICVISEQSYMARPPLKRWPLFIRLMRWLPTIKGMGRVIHIKYTN